MAIAVERKTATVNWLALSIGLFALIFVAAVVYFLFLSPTPGILRLIPPLAEEDVVKGVQNILGSGIDVQAVIQKRETLEDPKYSGALLSLPTPGDLGRKNPFLPI